MNTNAFQPKRDTQAWIFQVWASFIISVVISAYAVWNLPNVGNVQQFLLMGFVFTLFSALALSKLLRDNQYKNVDTPAWKGACWFAFAVAMGMTGWGLFQMNLDGWGKACVAVSWLYMVSASFTLAKTLRDSQDAGGDDSKEHSFRKDIES